MNIKSGWEGEGLTKHWPVSCCARLPNCTRPYAY